MVKYVKFNDMEYSTTDSEEDPNYEPIMECESCADSYEVIEEQNEKLFKLNNKLKGLENEISILRKIIFNITNEIKTFLD